MIHIDIEFLNLIVEVVPFRIGMRFGFGQRFAIRIRMKNTEIYKWFYSGLGRIWGDTPSWPQSRPALAQFEKPDVIELGVFVSSLAGLATSTLRLALRPNLPATSATSPTVRAPAAPPARAKPIELPTEGAFETSELPACAMRMNFWGAAARLLRPILFHFCRPCSGGVAGRGFRNGL